MYTVSVTEFKRDFNKYIELGQKEEIEVTKYSKVIFTIVPQKIKAYNNFMSFVGKLPKEASIGEDPDERGQKTNIIRKGTLIGSLFLLEMIIDLAGVELPLL